MSQDSSLSRFPGSTRAPRRTGPAQGAASKWPANAVTRTRTVTDQPSLLARIERAIYRLRNTHGLPLQPLGDGSDPEAVLRDCAADHVHMRRVLSDLREAIMEQVGIDQTDRLRQALADAVKALSA